MPSLSHYHFFPSSLLYYTFHFIFIHDVLQLLFFFFHPSSTFPFPLRPCSDFFLCFFAYMNTKYVRFPYSSVFFEMSVFCFVFIVISYCRNVPSIFLPFVFFHVRVSYGFLSSSFSHISPAQFSVISFLPNYLFPHSFVVSISLFFFLGQSFVLFSSHFP